MAEGDRCPQCGQPLDDDNAQTWQRFREHTARLEAERQELAAKHEAVRDERDALKVRNADLTVDNKRLKREAA